MIPLPIDSSIPTLIDAIKASRSLVLVAEPGAGKTTHVPPAILRANLLDPAHPNLIMLQPRRVAARASAARIADENNWQLGREVGYHVRFDRKMTRDTRLRVMTEGILTRQLLDDATLDGIGAVVLDEFHERSIHSDLAIAMLREIRQTVRDDLILIVMSATLDAEPVADFLGNAPIVRVEGRTFPVEISHRPQSTDRLEDQIADAFRGVATSGGHVLIFLPGVEEIRRAQKLLDPLAREQDALLLPLHGSLTPEEQDRALRPTDQRKIILATNIAETSLTIDGVRTVIDSGLARIASFDPQRGLDRLDVQRISRASASQRAGRAGRTGPGQCIRLWSASEDRILEEFESPEIKRVDLTPTVLALHAWGQSDPRKFGWYESPDERTIASAERLLEMLGATTSETNGQITETGNRLLALPVHPRLGRLLLAAADAGLPREGAAIAALLSEKDILRRSEDRRPSTQGPSDLLIRLDILESKMHGDEVDRGALWQVQRVRDELGRLSPSPGNLGEGRGEGDLERRKILEIRNHPHPNPLPAYRERGQEALLKLPLYAYPDRVCRRRGSHETGVMVGGGGVRLAFESVVRQHEFFLALDARHDHRNPKAEALVRIASAIEPAWLEEMFPHEIRRERNAVYDEQRDRVVGHGTIRYRDLLLREDKDAAVEDETATRVLIEWTRTRADELIESDEVAIRFFSRVGLLRKAMPKQDWPDVQATEILATACEGKRSLAQVRAALLDVIKNFYPYPLDRLIDTEAPETIEVPTGNRIRLDYPKQNDHPDQVAPPVLAVRLQEIFGWTETPRIAGGRVPVKMHLLAPNYRPVQITDDLKSFWSTTYFQVRKDLRVRYPKHSWPEDPLSAKPQAKGSRRR